MTTKIKRRIAVSRLIAGSINKEKLLLQHFYVITKLGEKGTVTVQDIAMQLRRAETQVYRYVKKLEDSGIMEVKDRMTASTGFKINTYKLTDYGKHVYYSFTGKEAVHV